MIEYLESFNGSATEVSGNLVTVCITMIALGWLYGIWNRRAFLKRPSIDPLTMASLKADTTLIVCAYLVNEESVIERTINRCRMIVPRGRIVLTWNGPQPQDPELLARLSEKCTVHYAPESKSRAENLNSAIAALETSYFVICDADEYLELDCLEMMFEALMIPGTRTTYKGPLIRGPEGTLDKLMQVISWTEPLHTSPRALGDEWETEQILMPRPDVDFVQGLYLPSFCGSFLSGCIDRFELFVIETLFTGKCGFFGHNALWVKSRMTAKGKKFNPEVILDDCEIGQHYKGIRAGLTASCLSTPSLSVLVNQRARWYHGTYQVTPYVYWLNATLGTLGKFLLVPLVPVIFGYILAIGSWDIAVEAMIGVVAAAIVHPLSVGVSLWRLYRAETLYRVCPRS